MNSVIHQGDTPTLGTAARAMRGLIIGYQRVIDHRPSPCRYVPSCSYYALEAVEVHGATKGVWLSVRRLLRCRPGGPSGWDPVPDTKGCLAPDPTASEAVSGV
ncbi:MAG: membrane protein insertion efficiency factor YidD [Acidimicrobiia bacterium]|nr:membrane protein insertion efficiency factor YidD [Acidimicrobiia bacterium]MYE72654.1 membrane protein insertion efficiency factor YidD [Acidimicrobiia bacterium]MYJ62708.1 membrane protein insertion efficiency factor YidD [Acidimicrobiia bacterium]